VPAARAGHVCVVTYKTGRFCAAYRAGEIPSVALKRDLRARGWIVVASN
jgi:sulfur transfer complex TusBCD TusB component (DsrH family)